MTNFIEAAGFVEVWNVRNERVSDRYPCRFQWRLGPGAAEFRLLTTHDIALSMGEEVWSLAITDDDGRLVFAHGLAHRPVIGGRLRVA